MNNEQITYWQAYKDTEADIPDDCFVLYSIAGNAQLADELLGLFLEGKKSASSGLVEDYLQEGDPLPKVGDYWVVLDSSQKPGCIVKTIAVDIFAFEDVPESVARAEGEGDLSLAYWRSAHGEFFKPYMQKLGIDDLNRAQVVVEHFQVVYPKT